MNHAYARTRLCWSPSPSAMSVRGAAEASSPVATQLVQVFCCGLFLPGCCFSLRMCFSRGVCTDQLVATVELSTHQLRARGYEGKRAGRSDTYENPIRQGRRPLRNMPSASLNFMAHIDSFDGRFLDPAAPQWHQVVLPNLRALAGRGTNYVRPYASHRSVCHLDHP